MKKRIEENREENGNGKRRETEREHQNPEEKKREIQQEKSEETRREQSWNSGALEACLEESLLADINPWKRPVSFLVWGILLLTIRLEFWKLGFLLPALGHLFLYLGLRSLRRENKWFFASWWISILSLSVDTVWLIWLATPSAASVFPIQGYQAIWEIGWRFSLFFCFRQGLKAVYEKAERFGEEQEPEERRDPVLWMMVWHSVFLLLFLFPIFQRWMTALLIVAAFLAILRQLYLLGGSLGDAGYRLEPVPVRIGSRPLSACYFAVLLAAVLGCCVWYSHPAMQGERTDSERAERLKQLQAESSDGEKIGQRLCSLGFPAELLADLTEEELELLKEAASVHVETEELLFHPRQIWVKTGDHSYNYSYYEEKRHRLDITMVFVELPQTEVYTAVFWQWGQGNPWWQDAFYFQGEDGTELVGGSLLYEKQGVDYRAEIPELGYQTSAGIIWEENQVITGKVSYPFGSGSQRGYLLCHASLLPEKENPLENGNDSASKEGDALEVRKTISVRGILTYYHDNLPFHFPYEDTQRGLLEKRYAGSKYQRLSFLGCELDLQRMEKLD